MPNAPMILIPVLSFLEEVKKMRSVPAMPTSEREREYTHKLMSLVGDNIPTCY